MPTRNERYYQLSTELAQVDDEQLNALLNKTEESQGWGKNQIIELGRSKIFIKRVPVTEIEYQHLFSTKNWYELPTYYNYGVGSAGFGIFRELVAHIKTTNWVLSGAIENFPLLYHYRIIAAPGGNPGRNFEDLSGYIKYWNSNQNIGKFVTARAEAKYEAVLFLEYFPHTLEHWLTRHPSALDMMINEMRETINFLGKNGIIHFDLYFDNIVTDGTKPYATDFGLLLDEHFVLNEAERSFFRKNSHYDYGLVVCELGWLLYSNYGQLTDKQRDKIIAKYGLTKDMPHDERWRILFDNIEALYADGLMKLDQHYVETVLKYKPVILLMHNFFSDMRRNRKKDTPFNDTELHALLQGTGFLPGKSE